MDKVSISAVCLTLAFVLVFSCTVSAWLDLWWFWLVLVILAVCVFTVPWVASRSLFDYPDLDDIEQK